DALSGASGLNTSAGPYGCRIRSDDAVCEPAGSQVTVPTTGVPDASSISTTCVAGMLAGRSLLNTRRICVPPASPATCDSGGVSGASPAASGSEQRPAEVHATSGETCCRVNSTTQGWLTSHETAEVSGEPGVSSRSMATPRTPWPTASCTMMRTSLTGPVGSVGESSPQPIAATEIASKTTILRMGTPY